MGMSNTDRNATLDHYTGNDATPTTFYLGLITSGTTELPVAHGYARQAVTFNAAGSPAAGQAQLTAQTQFLASGGNWGTVTAWGLYAASSGGSVKWTGALSSSRDILDGDGLTFPAGGLLLSLT